MNYPQLTISGASQNENDIVRKYNELVSMLNARDKEIEYLKGRVTALEKQKINGE